MSNICHSLLFMSVVIFTYKEREKHVRMGVCVYKYTHKIAVVYIACIVVLGSVSKWFVVYPWIYHV